MYVSGRAHICLKGAITVAHYLPAVKSALAQTVAVSYLGRQPGNMYTNKYIICICVICSIYIYIYVDYTKR